MNTQHGIPQASVSVMACHHTLRRRPRLRRALGALMLCLVWITNAVALPIGSFDQTPTSPGTLAPGDPGGPLLAPIVNAPLSLTISAGGPTLVALTWWQVGAPQTLVGRSVNGGPWTTIKTYGELPVDAFFTFQDQEATANAENCYVVIATDGVNPWSGLSTPLRCAFTRDERNLPAHRLQLRLRVADVADAGTDDAVEVRLQSPSLPTSMTNWYPAGNRTWIDSTADDFERGSARSYDLMPTNVSQVSDITMISISKTGHDDLCIAEVALVIDRQNEAHPGKPAFQQTFGDDAATCVWVTADNALHIDFHALRTNAAWNDLLSLDLFVGIDGAGLRSIIEALFAHTLHGSQGELRNGGTTTSQYISESTLHVSVPLVVRDVWVGPFYLGDVDSTVFFDLVMTPVEVHGVPTTQIAIENENATSGLAELVLWPLYVVSNHLEDRLADFDAIILDPLPLPGFHVCFVLEEYGGGFKLCYDSSAP